MTRADAYTVLVAKGYTGHEATRILDAAMRSGYALTAPRDCPSLHVDVNQSLTNWRIMENDSGTVYTLDTI